MYKISILLILTGLCVGCSSGPATSSPTPSPQSTKPAAVNTTVSTNANAPIVLSNDPQAANTNPDPAAGNANLTPTIAERIAKLRQKRAEIGNAPVTGPTPAPQYRPAAEDSMVATTMDTSGAVIETRIFKSDPKVAKVEMKWIGPKNSTMKIYLKDGRVVQAKGGNIENLGATPVATLLQIAGVK